MRLIDKGIVTDQPDEAEGRYAAETRGVAVFLRESK